MSRTTARENAFRLVYEFVETKERNDLTLDILTTGGNESDTAFTRELYDAVLENYDFLQGVIARYSDSFAYDRIYKTDLAVLLVAATEILLRDDIPVQVSVNEAVELSRTYSTDKSTSFVNGVLASIVAHKEELLHERADH